MHSLPHSAAIFATALRHGARLVALGATLLAGRLFAESVYLPSAPGSPAASFSAAVNWDFRRLEKLDAWQNTAWLIRRTLAEWYPGQLPGAMVENVDRGGLHGFFAGAARASAARWNFVYLASHQSAAGYWHFPHDTAQAWPEILADSAAPAKPPQCVIVDACYAEAAGSPVLFPGTGALGILYASNRTEIVHELNFHQRFPIDLTRRYAAEAKWLDAALGKGWNGRVSFLGFVWLRAFLATGRAPQTAGDWNAFFHLCENVAADFRRGRGEGLATMVHFVARPEFAPAKQFSQSSNGSPTPSSPE